MKTKLLITTIAMAALMTATAQTRGSGSGNYGFSRDFSGRVPSAPAGNSGSSGSSRNYSAPLQRSAPVGNSGSSGMSRNYSAPLQRSAPPKFSAPAAPVQQAAPVQRSAPVGNSGSSGSSRNYSAPLQRSTPPKYSAPAAPIRVAPVAPQAAPAARAPAVQFGGSANNSLPRYSAPKSAPQAPALDSRPTTIQAPAQAPRQTTIQAAPRPSAVKPSVGSQAINSSPASTRSAPPERTSRFGTSSGTSLRKPTADEPRSASPELSSKLQTGSLRSGSYSRPPISTKLTTPQNRVPGTGLGSLTTKAPAQHTGAKQSPYSGSSMLNARKPLAPSARLPGDVSQSLRSYQSPSGGAYPVRQRPGPLTGNSYSGSLRHSGTPPNYYDRNYNHNRNYSYNHYNPGYYHGGRYNYYNRYNNCFTPVWCGPVVYPSYYNYGYGSGFSLGFSWSSGNSWLSFSSSSLAYYNYNTPYYNSSYYGGYGYSSMYYGGWRSGWYGGLSYAVNPWPVYRTYYLYEPTPLVIQQPVIIQQAAVVYDERPYESYASTTQVQTQPITYVSQYNPEQIVVEERTTIRDTDQPLVYPSDAPVAYNSEYADDDLYEAYFDAGEYEREEFTLGFSSYATSLNPESIWISYAGLDRWQY